MAKKQTAEKIVEVAPPKKITKPSWEIKDRRYFLKDKGEEVIVNS